VSLPVASASSKWGKARKENDGPHETDEPELRTALRIVCRAEKGTV
jgi:hypothetical protein